MEDVLRKTALSLTEHFDTVVIICTRYDSATGDTPIDDIKMGNHFACVSSVEKYAEALCGIQYEYVDDEEGPE